ncbi:glutathione gamma-glutamylcysteinyltransferase 1-like isoform X2 [Panicum miliaceum]|uniref:Glutathione gamma-glutamylcysteinyltransferase 1-like isoform X2 n=1 Tax=Panicum miliaceum TaxID=4540 RepID=A0A3L6QKD4_PANMI|nr:glutathione gamma-glutamylcysteinyltransferase 1-like isoform X2 [Panicum miliaceum]
MRKGREVGVGEREWEMEKGRIEKRGTNQSSIDSEITAKQRASRGGEWRRCCSAAAPVPAGPSVAAWRWTSPSPVGKRLFAEALEGGTMEGVFSLASCFQT